MNEEELMAEMGLRIFTKLDNRKRAGEAHVVGKSQRGLPTKPCVLRGLFSVACSPWLLLSV